MRLLAWISLASLFGTALAQEIPKLDVVITGGRIVDGSGNPWYRADVGIREGRIVALGRLAEVESNQRIDAADRVVAPGFIDLMGQQTLVYVQDRVAAECRLRQGITTHVSGEGWSHAPQNERTQPSVEVAGRKVHWRTFAEYFRILEEAGLPLNVAHNVGAGQVRAVVMGRDDRRPTAGELRSMEELVDQAMRDGAGGLSTALIYTPGAFAQTEELIALARIAGRHGGVYSTHLRNESGQLLASIDEAIRIGREAEIAVHIYHLKAAGRENWPLMARAIERIDEARRRGIQVTADIYPYIRNGIGLAAFIPPWHYARGADAFLASLSDPAVRRKVRDEMELPVAAWENWYRHIGGDWDKALIYEIGRHPNPEIVGLSVAEAARRMGRDSWELFFELVQATGVGVAPESMDEEQKRIALRAPWTMIETDTQPINPATAKSTHPRAFGTFPRVLAKYVREENVLTLEDAVRRMTSLPATLLRMEDRGRIAPGMAADVVVFDPQKIQDKSTFANPLVYAEGVDYLLVNGTVVIDDGKTTGALPGQVLRHRAARLVETGGTSRPRR